MPLQLLLAGMAAAASGDSSDHAPDHLLSEKTKPSPEDEDKEEDSETNSSGTESLDSDTYDVCLATLSGPFSSCLSDCLAIIFPCFPLVTSARNVIPNISNVGFVSGVKDKGPIRLRCLQNLSYDRQSNPLKGNYSCLIRWHGPLSYTDDAKRS
ncbi:hypothetical protein Tco_1249844 [Tanacetum coccineum]